MNRPNEFVSASYPSGDGAIVWQPVMLGPNGHPNNNVVTDGRKPAKYPGMPTIAINIFSACCILLGVASIGVQVKPSNQTILEKIKIYFDNFFTVSF
jgi:hypothetical protein